MLTQSTSTATEIPAQNNLKLNLNDAPGAHNKNKPELEARVSKISVPSTWNMAEGTTGNNIYGGPDAAVSVSMPLVMCVFSPFNLSSDSDSEGAGRVQLEDTAGLSPLGPERDLRG